MSWLRRFRSPPWLESTLWAFDLEASDLEPATAQVLSVGMVPIREGSIRWGERWYSLVRPERPELVATEAIRIHEILPDELASAPRVGEIVAEVAKRLRDAVLLVHWRSLDVALLRRECVAAGLAWPDPQVVDTIDLLLRLDRQRRLLEPNVQAMPTQLAEARRELGLPPHLEHHALHDALATAELFLALADRLSLRTLRQLR